MADARSRAEWWRASELMALIVNVNRDPKKSPIKAAKFNPFAEKPKPLTVEQLTDDIMKVAEARRAKG